MNNKSVSKYKWIIITIITAITLVVACKSDDNKPVIWIGAYTNHGTANEPSYSSLQTLFEMKGDRIRFKHFDYQSGNKGESEEEHHYKIEGDNLLIYSPNERIDTLRIFSQSEDSIVFKSIEYATTSVFKKFDESRSPKTINMEGNAYWFNLTNYSDTLEFVNDSIFIRLGKENYHAEHWAINTFDDYSFLVLGQLTSPYFIKAINGDTVHLINYGVQTNNISLVPVLKSSPVISLIGTWNETSRLSYDPELKNFPFFQKMQLHFKKDSVNIIEGKQNNNTPWSLNVTNQFIYFPLKVFSSTDWYWKILELQRDTLVIERNYLGSFPTGIERIEFSRQTNK